MQSTQTIFLPHHIVRWQNASSNMFSTGTITLYIAIFSFSHSHPLHKASGALTKLHTHLHLKKPTKYKLESYSMYKRCGIGLQNGDCIKACVNTEFETNLDNDLTLPTWVPWTIVAIVCFCIRAANYYLVWIILRDCMKTAHGINCICFKRKWKFQMEKWVD